MMNDWMKVIGGMVLFLILFFALGQIPRGMASVSSKEIMAPDEDFIETAFGINMKMMYVEGGEFLMGGTPEQGEDAYDDEKPIHKVALDAYYIGAFEVTQGQWEKVMGTNPSYFTKGEDYPVERVSWEDAQAFCRELSRKTGRKYSLPTEAQWEYAARGGKKNESTKYSGSSSIDSVGWYCDNTNQGTYPVGQKHPNALGIYDMSGNVREWCQDWYGENYYADSPLTNPTGPSTGFERVMRGGSWFFNARSCRVSQRGYTNPNLHIALNGFRLCLIP